MATAIAITQGTGNYPTAANIHALTFTAGDTVNGNFFNPSGYDLLVIKGVGTATIEGTPDLEARSLNEVHTSAAGEYRFKLFDTTIGWIGSQGIKITSSAATLSYAVVRL
jgi:hypothetical protein